MATSGAIEAVEVYTTNEPCMARTTEYKGLVMVSKVKTRNMLAWYLWPGPLPLLCCQLYLPPSQVAGSNVANLHS